MALKFITDDKIGFEVPLVATAFTDDDGDLSLIINGVRVLYIDAESGMLHLVGLTDMGALSGIPFDANGRIKVAKN